MTKFEYWAMPHKDEKVMPFTEQHKSLFRNPKKLAILSPQLERRQRVRSNFCSPAVMALIIGLPESKEVATALKWAVENDRFVISLCHGCRLRFWRFAMAITH